MSTEHDETRPIPTPVPTPIPTEPTPALGDPPTTPVPRAGAGGPDEPTQVIDASPTRTRVLPTRADRLPATAASPATAAPAPGERAGTPSGPAPTGRGSAPTDDRADGEVAGRPAVRVGTAVWGLVLAILGFGVIAAAGGARFDVELVAIGLLALAGAALVVGSVVTARRRH